MLMKKRTKEKLRFIKEANEQGVKVILKTYDLYSATYIPGRTNWKPWGEELAATWDDSPITEA